MTNDTEPRTFGTKPQVYVAMRALMIPQGPGVIPSTVRFMQGELFELDGDEPIRVDKMLQLGSIRKWEEGDPEPPIVPSEADKRRVRRAKQKATRRTK